MAFARIEGNNKDMTTQATIVINSLGLEEKQRTTARGTKSRYTVTIKAQPIALTFSAKELGAAPAEAIRQHLSDAIKGITEVAKPATILARRKALEAFRRGEGWATRRYSGGRTGATPPDPTKVRLFNDSGRLANGISVRNSGDDSWTVNVPANRFDPATFVGGRDAMIRMVERLQELVPTLGDANRLADVPAVRDAISDTVVDIGIRADARRARTLRQWQRAYKQGRAGLRDAIKLLGGAADLLRAGGMTI